MRGVAVRKWVEASISLLAGMFIVTSLVTAEPDSPKLSTFGLGNLKPIDSELKVASGQKAPEFTLPSVSGKKISLSQFKGKKNVVLSFVPAAWTPVCSDQWPGYNLAQDMFSKGDAVLIGITVDNIPSLQAWTAEMGQLWFHVLSDFWPHGSVADKYGVLRSDGLAERALVFIDKQGIIRAIVVMDINKKPNLQTCSSGLKKLKSCRVEQ
jgi:peroxiredoxin (alkyl hydroperoxide reductase subunit C)